MEYDGFLWNEEENDKKAFYIHKLVIKLEFSGQGYAEKSMFLIKELGMKAEVSYLRLDCYDDRIYLKQLYEKRKTVMDDSTAL